MTMGGAVMVVIRAVADPSIPGFVRTSVRRYEASAESANSPPTDNVENVSVGHAIALVRRWLEDLANGEREGPR